MAGNKQASYDARRRQILEGALKVFGTRGFIEATNKDIAEAAGINSPGLIYHYFASKEEVLRAAIEEFAPPWQLLTQEEAFLALPVEEALRRFAHAYMRIMDDRQIGACMRLLIGEALRSPKFAETFGQIGPLRIWKRLADYLQIQMEAGKLRPLNPMVASRCFISSLFTYIFTRNILRLPDALDIEATIYADTVVDLWLKGMRGNQGEVGDAQTTP